MRQLDEYQWSPRVGRPQKYPWDKWENGETWEIAKGEDYHVSTHNMQINLHVRAANDNKKVRTRTIRDDEGEKLVFQFLNPQALSD